MDCLQGSGGISRVNWLVISGFNTEKYDIEVLGMFAGEEERYKYSDAIKTSFLFEEQIPNHKRFLKAVIAIRKYLIESEIDILICSGEINFPMIAIATMGLKIKTIGWEHSNVSVHNEHKFQKICRMIGAKTADQIVTLTLKDQQLYEETYHIKNCVHIYNPVDDCLMGNVNYSVDSKKIISVGRLCYQKNFEATIEVAKKILFKYKNWSWDIYGDGEDYEKLSEKIKAAGLDGRLLLKGRVDDLYDRYSDYAFLVMTSRFEGFPMTLLESTAKALPSIAFDVLTGPNEIIKDGITGYLICFDDIDTMADKISFLIENRKVREEMSVACLKKRYEYDRTRIISQWENLIDIC